LTVAVNCSIDAAVSSSELACSSVRDDRSRLPAAICAEAVAIASAPPRTSPTIRCRLVFICCNACSSIPVSSLLRISIRVVRSPAATARATPSAWFRGADTACASSFAITMPSTMVRTTPPMTSSRARPYTACTSLLAWRDPRWLSSTSLPIWVCTAVASRDDSPRLCSIASCVFCWRASTSNLLLSIRYCCQNWLSAW
jgi:hypothetical protein